MKTKIGIWGSCVTRDIFRSVFNNYKEYFEIVYELERISLISLMGYGNGFEFNGEDIQIYPLTNKNKHRSELLRRDLSKEYLKILGKNIDYLIIDEFFEAYFGVIKMHNTYITYNYWDYPDTKFYDSINKNNILTLNNDFLEYYALWKINCDKFFDFFYKNFPDVKIVLNKVKLTSKILGSDGSYYIDEEFQIREEIFNPLIKLLENYLEKYHNVIIVDCTNDVVVNENHIWGKGVVHYHDDFYICAFKKILEIINENRSNNEEVNNDNFYLNTIDSEFKLDSEENNDSYLSQSDLINNDFGELSPESKFKEYLDIKKFLFEEASVNENFIEPYRLKDYLNYTSKNNFGKDISIQESSFNELININHCIVENKDFLDEITKNIENKINSPYFDENAEFLIKYLESRIDIKNYGNENNDIVLLTYNDPSLNITHPSWFNNKNGNGTIITSVKGDLKLSFKCVNNGKLCIDFKSIDYRDKKRNSIPIYIDYTEIVINDEVIVDKSHVSWHNSPLIFEKEVEDGEIINVSVKWNPINYKSNIFLNNNYYDKLLENFYNARIDIKNFGKESNDLILVDCDDDLSDIYKPNWLKNEYGVGTVVSSSKGNINMSFKCVGDGILEIDFMSIDLKDDYGRIPIFIDYTKINVDGRDIVGNNHTAWHNNPFVFKQKVKNNQIINIRAEWKPLSRGSKLPLFKTNNDDLNIYSSARIDIKNYGAETNDILLLNEKSFYKISKPEWFSDLNGIGSVISSHKGMLNLSFRCINDGKLKIDFRSIDFKDADNNRIPIYIDYKEIKIDGESIINESTVSWHDNPLFYEKDVNDGQIVNMRLKWEPLNSNSNCQNILINNNSKDEVIKKLKNEYNELNLKNKELNNRKLELLGSDSSKVKRFFTKIKNIIK
ncbi:DUF6270 domain-containing protein [Methanobrevibacter sp.]|uniref:DUF6270 domain-containing protein n=1 Tax=Methanobrevibacter sp. TaxID=66852 RepID=UPI002E79D935|nr:DUF6270 domain-containing protein [Methanobrevibacter sp.]MEE0024275.1 DUF6270 domain-containing protein [Methanobrevibacter sp.]